MSPASDDRLLHRRIAQLVDEMRMTGRPRPGGRPSGARRDRLQIEDDLDRCWDLIRQRRARRRVGQDPDLAMVRTAAIVDGYRQ